MSFGAKRLCDPELIRERSIMREHLFRGKLKNKEKWMDKGEWIEGSLLCYDVEGMIECRIIESLLTGGREARAIAYEVDPETVCQYTGWADKKSRIYEGDIFQASDGDYIQRYIITWSEDSLEWSAECIGDPDGTLPLCEFKIEEIDVLGNKFDNPQLTEKGGGFTYEHDRK